MQNKKLTIRQIVSYLNDDEADGGGFWLPLIQRHFVWTEDQIAKLFDSIMREYPISTLLVWRTRESVKHRKFVENYTRDIDITSLYVPDHNHSKMMVLDGQQRLQSLFIGLKGSYGGRELYFNVLSGAVVAPEEIRFRFAFLDNGKASWPWVRFKDIVSPHAKLAMDISEQLVEAAPSPLNADDLRTVQRNVERARQHFVNDPIITYQELDGIDDPDAYKLDDVVEIFIRANSGGTKLGKSDLLFSLLAGSWDAADREIEALLDELNGGMFEFDRDFVLKSCLTVLGKGARYEVNKFRDGKTKEEIIADWPKLAEAMKNVRDFVVSSTYIRSDKAMPSYLALIPLIYYCYWHPRDFERREKELARHLLRVLVASAYGGSPDNLIDKIVKSIQKRGDFDTSEVEGIIRDEGRSLEITPSVIYRQMYGSRTIHLFFNLWYSEFQYNPALDANGPQIDHIFPQSVLKRVRVVNTETGIRNLMAYTSEKRDQIANCMLLTAKENGFGEGRKCDTLPKVWFARSRFSSDAEHADYLRKHLIPTDPALWELDRFPLFIEARKELIKEKFSYMLRSEPPAPEAQSV